MAEELIGKCPSCVNSIHCKTWGEWKCRKLKQRIYGYKTLTDCKFYKKRAKDFKESTCQCEDCLKNDISSEGDLED